MRRARFLASAQHDLAELRGYLTRASGSLTVARRFTERLRERCHSIAGLPDTLGREREDLGRGLRSVAHGSYVIIFRYLGDRMQVVRIVHGRRDLPAVMKQDDQG